MGIFFGYNKQLTDLTPEPLITFFALVVCPVFRHNGAHWFVNTLV